MEALTAFIVDVGKDEVAKGGNNRRTTVVELKELQNACQYFRRDVLERSRLLTVDMLVRLMR